MVGLGMNYPHVQAIHFKVEHSEDVDYDKAQATSVDLSEFVVNIDKGNAVIEMKQHFANAEAALAVVLPVLKAWEIYTDLVKGPGEIRFVYQRADVVDRTEELGHYTLVAESASYNIGLGSTFSAHV